MVIRTTLPFGEKKNVKDLVFTILTKEYPLKIIELTNLIRKRYGRGVTFQAVRKAILELVEENVLGKKGKEFSINKEWVYETKTTLNDLYEDLTKKKTTPKSIESIKGEISVFTFNSINELMKFWEDIIDDWYENYKKGGLNINCYQGIHGWEGLLHPDREKVLMGRLKKKGIKSYALSSNKTPLDRYIWKFYKSIGLKVGYFKTTSSFDKNHYIATYGDIIVQATYPKKIVEEMERFFKKNKTIEDLNLKELSDIANKKVKVQLTVIKNKAMAEQINKSIMKEIA